MRTSDLTNICVSVLLFVFPCFGQHHGSSAPAEKEEIPTLELEQTAKREMAPMQKHSYKIRLNAGQFARIEVEQLGIDVVFSCISPEGHNVLEFKNASETGVETTPIAAETSGDYTLRVFSLHGAATPGSYVLKFSELRPATGKELSFAGGIRLMNSANKMAKSGATADTLRRVIDIYGQALEKFRSFGKTYWESSTLTSIGNVYGNLGDRRTSIEYALESIKVAQQNGYQMEESLAQQSLGLSYAAIGEPEKALKAFFRSVELERKIDNPFQEADSLTNIGLVYTQIGDSQRAVAYFEQSLKLARENQNLQGEALANIYLGRRHGVLGDPTKAAEHFQKALEIVRRTKNGRLEVMSLTSLARLQFQYGEYEKCLETLNASLDISRGLDHKPGLAAALQMIGQVHLTRGDNTKALEHLNRSLELRKAVEDTFDLAENLRLLAKAEKANGSLEAAQLRAEEAIGIIESVRARVNQAEMRDSFSVNLQDFYGLYIEILMERHKLEPAKNYAALAFQASERARARGFLNLLAESGTDIRQGVDEKLLRKEDEIRGLLSSRRENLTKVLSGNPQKEVEQELKSEIERIRTEHERVQEQIRSASPRYAALTQPRALSLQEIQAAVLDADTVLLEYFLGRTRSFVWAVTKTGFHSVELPDAETIENKARQFYGSLTARNKDVKFETPPEREARITRADTDLEKDSRELGEMVIAPVARLIPGKRLLIVADGALQYVPFSALAMPVVDPGSTTARTRFLVESNEIVSLPSASALAVMRKETAGRPDVSRTLAVLADPVFDTKDERFQTSSRKKLDSKESTKVDLVAASRKQTRSAGDLRDGLDLSRLPFTRREAEMITSVLPDGQKEKWLDFDASRVLATSSRLANYRFVHFATHGIINDKNPELSGLVFSTVDQNGKELDGFLRVGDIYNLKLPAEMIVLSGCRTGMGKEIRGEGIIGMTRAFMYAGARRVTVSLWDINDEATSDLMSHFYREMFAAKKRSPAAALRQAQNAMLKDKRWSSPYFWATFVLQGEPN